MGFDRVLTKQELQRGSLLRTEYLITGPPWVSNPNGVYSEYCGSSAVLGRSRTTQCNKTKKFKKGEVFSLNPIVQCSYEGSCKSSDTTVYRVWYGKLLAIRKISGQIACNFALSPSLLPVPSATDSQLNDALVQATASVGEATVGVGLMMAEAKETLGMLAQPLRALPKLLKKLERPKVLPRKKGWLQSRLDYATGAWMTYRYGIMPLVYDIDSVRSAINGGFKTPLIAGKERGKSGVVKTYYDIPIQSGVISGVYLFGSKVEATDWRVVSTVYFSGALDMGAQLGVSVYDIPGLIWELTPLSFVGDWIVDVGSWLTAIKPKPGITELGNTVSVVSHKRCTITIDSCCMVPIPSENYPVSPVNNVLKQEWCSYQRFIGRPLPPLPVVNPNLTSWKRQLDSISLLWQFLPKSKFK